MQIPGSHVIVAGGSVSGLMAAMSAAKHGFDVTVVERFGEVATRKTIFNLPPSTADALKMMDDGGDGLVSALQTIRSRSVDDSINGQKGVDNAGDRIIADPRNPVDWQALVDGFTGADSRAWNRVEIGGIENHMRDYIATRFPQVKFLWNTTVTGIDQGVNGITAHVKGPSGRTDAVHGSLLISATGGRNVLGVERNLAPEKAHFVGGVMEPVSPEDVELRRVYRDGSEWDASTHDLNPPGQGFATVELTGTGRKELPNSLIWAQINRDPNTVDDADALKRVVLERARMLDLGHLKLIDKDPLLKVNVQIGLLRDNAAVHGRVILAGDELIGPYFPTSTGGAHAIGVNGPRIDRLMHDLSQPGADVDRLLKEYDVDARKGAEEVFKISRNELREDLGLPRLPPGQELDGLLPAERGIGNAAP